MDMAEASCLVLLLAFAKEERGGGRNDDETAGHSDGLAFNLRQLSVWTGRELCEGIAGLEE